MGRTGCFIWRGLHLALQRLHVKNQFIISRFSATNMCANAQPNGGKHDNEYKRYGDDFFHFGNLHIKKESSMFLGYF
jgi:hypothetical protein